jgi:hypothetical protein
MTPRLLAAVLFAALAVPGRGQDRPSEDELFGKGSQDPGPVPKKADAPAPGAQGPAKAAHADTEAELFGAPAAPAAPQSGAARFFTKEKEDWLKIGGQLQLEAQVSAYEGAAPRDWPLASPNLLDVYLDARPNDRVRAFVLGRLNWDPTVGSRRGTNAGAGTGTSTSPLGPGANTGDNPGGVLDQLWLNFDLYHRAFVTAGRQHVKWGVGKFWNPTDYLHPLKRDPLATLDTRTGTTLLKVHVPWEKEGWNFYAVSLLDDASGETTQPPSRLGRVGGGGRAELVLGPAELGLDLLAQDGHHARYGLDLSGGLLDVDLYGEAALRTGGDGPRFRREAAPSGPTPSLSGWAPDTRERLTPQLVAGGSWSHKYTDEDTFTVSAEYFYNSLGYDHPSVYPYLLLGAPRPDGSPQDPEAFRSFYLGRHYAALSVTFPKPGSWNDTTLSLTTLGNLSDRSYVARLDCSVLALTYLTVETYVDLHFGNKGGEFRLALPADLAALVEQAYGTQSFPTGAPLVDVGIGLRLSL